jgi:ribosomal protein S6--L-glutamate ligase
VAGAVVDYLAAQVDFPEIDIRQRLTVSKGYGVTELYIPEGSKFVGQGMRDTQLADKDINVLTLYRDSKVIPNPRADRILEPGDKLLCYGRLEAMRDMIPARTRRKRSPQVKELDTNITSASSAE